MHSYFKVNVFSNIFKNTSGEEENRDARKKRLEEIRACILQTELRRVRFKG